MRLRSWIIALLWAAIGAALVGHAGDASPNPTRAPSVPVTDAATFSAGLPISLGK